MKASFLDVNVIKLEAETPEERLLIGVFIRSKSKGEPIYKHGTTLASFVVTVDTLNMQTTRDSIKAESERGYSGFTIIAEHPKEEKPWPKKC